MSYYENGQWPATGGQNGWEHQTPPARSGANSAILREEPAAFAGQLEEVDRAVDNLLKSGKMFPMSGPRREMPVIPTGPSRTRYYSGFDPRMGPGGGGRPHPMADFGDARGAHGHPPSNLQNFYASQRYQTSRGANEAEQMLQAKKRMAAQRERELRNYHQEQQYNRTVLAELTYGNKPERTLSPGSMSEEDRRDLIARQRSALYGEGPFAEAGGYIDESGTPRTGMPASQNVPATLRSHSPLTYGYNGRAPSVHPETGSQPSVEGGQGTQQAPLPKVPSRANSTSSPQSNPPTGSQQQQPATRTSASSPGGSPPRTIASGSIKSGQCPPVAPIGTRPSGVATTPVNTALGKRSTTPLPSPLSQGHSAPDTAGNIVTITSGAPSNPAPAIADGPSVALSGWGGGRSGVWGNKAGLGVQASVWG